MNIAVLGLWHLGSVTAACLASAGHTVTGWDPDAKTVSNLNAGVPPVSEPGLAELVKRGTAARTLAFTDDLAAAVTANDVIWITFDTPVDDDDRADVGSVLNEIRRTFPHLRDGALVVSSSQLPVRSLGQIESDWAPVAGGRQVSFACVPENLRLGKALDVFLNPDRVIAGVRDARGRARLAEVLAPITDRIEWMSIESAEMTKHAINAFLATSVTFINELAGICERVGADAKDVERGLKTESRIGPKAYLGPGAAFAGGTLARDVLFLRDIGEETNQPTPLMDGVESSNLAHRNWARRRLELSLGSLDGRTVAVWGLTYKAGTDTLRRSTAVELCRWLLERGARVRVHDPAVAALSGDLERAYRATTPVDAATGADALVVATEWPVYRDVDIQALAGVFPAGLVFDANRFTGKTLGADSRFRVISVGSPNS